MRKRAAASSAFAQGQVEASGDDREDSSDGTEAEDKRSMDDELDSIMDDSPFDRSYFSFDHEESNDGRDHVAHIGGRALDAVVVSLIPRIP